jgi:putative DNA primase/helicase
MGDYAKRAPAQMLLAQKDGAIPADVAAMKGARFVTVSETDEGKRLGEALIKDITGNETMAARFLHANWFEFRPECKIWLGTNHRPDIRGGDQAIWDRVKLLPFAVRIPEREQDRELGDKLNEELPGILAWAVRGCLEWQGKGIGFPPEVINATKEYQVDVDALGAFIEDCCIVGPTLRGKPAQLYDAYDAWCRMNNEHAVSKKMFGMKLKDRGFTAGKTDSDRWWGGVGLKYPTRDA